MKYAKQPDAVSCGPTAILNALKWAGYPANVADHLPVLQFSCQTFDVENPTDFDAQGTTEFDFDRVLRYAGKKLYSVKRKIRPTIAEIVSHLEFGGALALAYDWSFRRKVEGHFVFIAGMKRNHLMVVNDHLSKKDSVSLRKPQTIEKWITHNNYNSVAWFLTPKNIG